MRTIYIHQFIFYLLPHNAKYKTKKLLHLPWDIIKHIRYTFYKQKYQIKCLCNNRPSATKNKIKNQNIVKKKNNKKITAQSFLLCDCVLFLVYALYIALWLYEY